MPVTKTCLQCGQAFEVLPSRRSQKFCSRQCMAESFRTGRIATCANCGNETYRPRHQLEKSRSGLYFCSPQCLGEYAATVQGHQALKPDARRQYDKRLQGKRVECAFCGKQVYKTKSQIARSKSGLLFCSPQCVGEYSRTGQNLQCDFCGKVIYRAAWQIASSEKHYCSTECRSNARRRRSLVECKYCGRKVERRFCEIEGKESFFCSRDCKLQYFVENPGPYVPRERLIIERAVCDMCGLRELDILEIHHKDGNRRNNAEENLLVVCPSCHARIHRVFERQ